MPDAVEETVQGILDDPSSTDDEEEAYAIAWDQHEGDAEKRADLAKSAPNGSIAKMEFEVSTEGSVGVIFKADDDFVIWGPASVEVVDKERDRIKAKALEDALPQLLKRKRLSYEHSDQIVGDILERFETDEPVDVEIAGNTYKRDEFPTDVLELDGLKPGLFVAGNVYNDTRKSQEVREEIEKREVDSYSISGEAIVTEMAVKDGQTFTDILKLDLSAVTLCKEGMNQKAKFAVVSKQTASTPLDPQRAASLAKSRLDNTMSNDDNDDDDDVQKFVDALDKTLEERLPEGELATKEDVEEMVDERLKAQEGSPSEGTPERPDGEGDHGQETDPEHEGDNPDNTASDSDKVEEKSDAYTMDELKAALPDDQYKAIEPLLERGDGSEDEMMGDQPEVDPTEEKPEEMVEPEMPDVQPEEENEEGQADPVLASKAVDNLDWDRLSEGQKRALAKAGSVEKSESGVRANTGVGAGATPAHAGSRADADEVAKADGDAVAADPALRKVYDDEGTPQI